MTGRRWRHDNWRWVFSLAANLFAVLALFCLPGMAHAAADPALTLEPDRGSCTAQLVIQGANFPPGQVIHLTARAGRNDVVIQFASSTVAADGTFTLQVDGQDIEPSCRASSGPLVPDGAVYTILGTRDDPQRTVLARATFTLTTSATRPPGLPNTGAGGTQAHTLLPVGSLVASGLLVAVGAALLRAARLRRRAR